MGLLIKKKKKVRQCKKRYGAIPVPVFYRTLTGLDHNNNNRKKKNENYTYDKLWIRSLISEKKNRFEIKNVILILFGYLFTRPLKLSNNKPLFRPFGRVGNERLKEKFLFFFFI